MSELKSALQAAHAAGAILLEHWPGEHQVRVKGYRDIVTEADVASQAVIIERLRRDFPDHAILAEEGGAVQGAGDLCPTWVVDPLDGTTNYAHRLPSWCVSIGLVYGAEVRVGVVHDSLRGLTFWAERGQGAYLSRGEGQPAERLAVSQTDRLAAAVVALDWAHDDRTRRETLAAFDRVALICTSVRTLGSACLAMCAVAAGWIDAYFHFSPQPWDVAGPSVIVAEAGGRLTTPGGRPWQMGELRVAMSNGRIHEELLEVMGVKGDG
jgi:myo-inositol-1(or 4)-monophosphatase